VTIPSSVHDGDNEYIARVVCFCLLLQSPGRRRVQVPFVSFVYCLRLVKLNRYHRESKMGKVESATKNSNNTGTCSPFIHPRLLTALTLWFSLIFYNLLYYFSPYFFISYYNNGRSLWHFLMRLMRGYWMRYYLISERVYTTTSTLKNFGCCKFDGDCGNIWMYWNWYLFFLHLL